MIAMTLIKPRMNSTSEDVSANIQDSEVTKSKKPV